MTTQRIDITEQMIELLGKSVEQAYGFVKARKTIKGEYVEPIVDKDGSIMPSDCYPVVIKMIGKKKVVLWCSEWGGLMKITTYEKEFGSLE